MSGRFLCGLVLTLKQPHHSAISHNRYPDEGRIFPAKKEVTPQYFSTLQIDSFGDSVCGQILDFARRPMPVILGNQSGLEYDPPCVLSGLVYVPPSSTIRRRAVRISLSITSRIRVFKSSTLTCGLLSFSAILIAS